MSEQKEWVDPYIGQAGPPPLYSGPLPPDLKTRRDCTLLGIKVFVLVPALFSLLSLLLYLIQGGPRHPYHEPIESPVFILQTLVVVLPPAALLGAAVGFEVYRLAAGSRQPREIGCVIWLLFVLVMSYFAFVLFLMFSRRKKLIVEGKPVSWYLPLGLTILNVLLCFVPGLIILIVMLSLLISDCIVVNMVALWLQRGRLAAPQSHNIQFSLGTLMIFMLGLGAWLTALVRIFGR